MIAVKLDNISKYYTLYANPKDRLKEIIFRKPYHKKHWVLKNINLEINTGEVLGIIGDNGAGKSTLLKIISKILPPSSGSLEIKGKVSPILELGMGFHPELTGIENINLSGRLLGLTNKEIKSKTKEIIEFSELGDFIYQPLKTYSSGMQVRLAFSVATAIDPDILVIDEALSVGDAYFQKKSLDKIIEFKKKNKTIIFCSHSMYHITNLCNNVAWIENGIIRMEGKAEEVVDEYQNFLVEKQEKKSVNTDNIVERDILVKIKKFSINKEYYEKGENIIGKVEFENPYSYKIHFGFGILKNDKTLYATSTYHDHLNYIEDKKGQIKFIIKNIPFIEGKYKLNVAIIDETANLGYDIKSVEFSIIKTSNDLGYIWIDHTWEI